MEREDGVLVLHDILSRLSRFRHWTFAGAEIDDPAREVLMPRPVVEWQEARPHVTRSRNLPAGLPAPNALRKKGKIVESATYSFGPGGDSRRGTPAGSASYSTTPWFARGQVPFDGSEADEWSPPDDLQSSDPHDQPPFSVGDGPPSTGEVPSNIIAGDGDIGSVAASFDGGIDTGDVPGNIHVD